MYADYRFASVDGISVKDLIAGEDWNRHTFLPTVGQRGTAVIEARGLSSAASAATAIMGHMRDWMLGSGGKWVSMGVPSQAGTAFPKA